MTMRFGLGRFLGVYFVLLLLVVATGWPIGYWLATVAFYGVPYVIWRLLRFVRSKSREEVEQLLNWIETARATQERFQDIWIGRKVRLLDDIRNSKEPEGHQVYVRAGTVGEIVALTDDEHAPFHIRFPGFAYKIAVRLEKLDLNPTGNYKYT